MPNFVRRFKMSDEIGCERYVSDRAEITRGETDYHVNEVERSYEVRVCHNPEFSG